VFVACIYKLHSEEVEYITIDVYDISNVPHDPVRYKLLGAVRLDEAKAIDRFIRDLDGSRIYSLHHESDIGHYYYVRFYYKGINRSRYEMAITEGTSRNHELPLLTHVINPNPLGLDIHSGYYSNKSIRGTLINIRNRLKADR
jgi:hypothetical protein